LCDLGKRLWRGAAQSRHGEEAVGHAEVLGVADANAGVLKPRGVQRPVVAQ
jgi:hypothetical protein